MNKEAKTFLYFALFIIFMVVIGFSYKYLSERYQADNLVSPNPSIESSPKVTPGSSPEATDPESEDDGKIKAPDFTVYDADGNEVKLSDYLGTPVVLNFWASWCPPCKSEMPHFNKVSEEYSEDELVFLMIDLVDGDRETVESGLEYIEENNYTSFTVLFDKKQDAAKTYGIRSIPTTLFIDKEGYVIKDASQVGPLDEKRLKSRIEYIYP